MADTNQALLKKNSSSIGGIKKAVSSFGKSLYAANRTSSKIIKSIYSSNREKKRAIARTSSLVNLRKEAVRRRETGRSSWFGESWWHLLREQAK